MQKQKNPEHRAGFRFSARCSIESWVKGRVAKLVIGRVEAKFTPSLRSFNFSKSEESREQIILIVDGPITDATETLPQPQHRLDTGNCSSRRLK